MDQLAIGSKTCPDCANQMPEAAGFCPGCGRSMQPPPRAQGKVGAFPESIAGALAYLSFLPAIVFLFLEPYRSNRFVRLHSIQCLLCWLIGIVLASSLRLLGLVVFWIPMLGPLLLILMGTVLALAIFVLWLVLIVKALQGETFPLPWIGDWAEQHAGPDHQT